MAQERNWWMYFNPCGGQPLNGFELKRCFSACEQTGASCLASGAFQIARYILNGSTLQIEKGDYAREILGIGRVVTSLEGNPIQLTQENINPLLNATAERAQNIIDAISICVEKTVPLTEEYLGRCSEEQRSILDSFMGLNELANNFRGSQEEAQQLIDQMRETLKRAIDHDLDELALITRQAIAYGLGERVLAKRGIPIGIIPVQVGRLKRA